MAVHARGDPRPLVLLICWQAAPCVRMVTARPSASARRRTLASAERRVGFASFFMGLFSLPERDSLCNCLTLARLEFRHSHAASRAPGRRRLSFATGRPAEKWTDEPVEDREGRL